MERHELLRRAYALLVRDPEYRILVEMSNVQAVKRLLYNDHGVLHAKIVAGASLEIFRRLVESGVTPSTLAQKTASSLEESMLVVLLGAMLHDVGNSVHRDAHELLGAVVSEPLLNKVLKKLFSGDVKKALRLKYEVLSVIVSSAYEVKCLSVEAGSVKLGDGTDMAKGRARVPYELGKLDIHAISALSIDRVSLSRGLSKPVSINVYMKEGAGIFQVEKVLLPKLRTSGLENFVEVSVYINGKHLRTLA